MLKQMHFPNTRLRRKRLHNWLRNLSRENVVSVNDLILPLFVHEEEGIYEPLDGLTAIKRYSITALIDIVKKAQVLGINSVALFPVLNYSLKTEDACEAFNPHNLMCRAIRTIKNEVSGIGIIADVALDPYTKSGHDGILVNNQVDNDASIPVLCKQALVLAAAGCDIVAPSDMMDGRIKAIREALDNCNFQNICILAYSAKYCSNFYGPFREAVDSCTGSQLIDKSSYQLDSANIREALLEIQMDISEGADIVMVKPGMPYLDVIRCASDQFDVPIFSYQVSGEYAMIKAAADKGWIDYEKAMYESLLCFKRAGAKSIFTYAALEMAQYHLCLKNC